MKICLLLLACASLGMAQILGSVPGPELGPVYTLQKFIPTGLNSDDRMDLMNRLNVSGVVKSSTETHFEWEGYDGWYNNPAHPEWGGAGKFAKIFLALVVLSFFFCTQHFLLFILHKLCINFLLLQFYVNYYTSFIFKLHLIDFPLERKTPVVYEDGVYEIVAEERRGNVLVISNLTQHGLSGLGSSRRTAFFIFFGMSLMLCNAHDWSIICSLCDVPILVNFNSPCPVSFKVN